MATREKFPPSLILFFAAGLVALGAGAVGIAQWQDAVKQEGGQKNLSDNQNNLGYASIAFTAVGGLLIIVVAAVVFYRHSRRITLQL